MQDAAGALEQDATGVSVTLRSGERVRAGHVVAADGLHSRVRAQVAGRVRRGRVRYGFVRHVARAPETSAVTVHWTPAGEAYVTPLSTTEVGVAVLAADAAAARRVVALSPRVAALLGDDEGWARGAGPLWQLPDRRVRGRVLLVGDAAGYVDALTGEGLSVGFAQARAAVRAVADGTPGRYEREWWRVSARPLALTGGLVVATRSAAVRGRLVPVARRVPWAFRAMVDVAAGAA